MADAHRLEKYLTAGEKVVVATHRHWFAIAEPLATAVGTLLVIGIAFAAGAPAGLVQALLVAWLVVFGRAAISVWEWNDEWFVATDQRLLLIYGFIIRKVDMLPLSKVTDMTFRRSVMGRLLGYGTFVLESAGQDQALSDIHFIPDPNATYLRIVGTIFKTGEEEDGMPATDSPEDVGDLGDIDDLAGTGDGGRAARRRRWRLFRRNEEDVEDSWDDEEDDDPTSRPALRGVVVRDRGDDPDTESFDRPRPRGAHGRNPVDDHRAGRRRRNPDYAETLYSSRKGAEIDPWDEDDHGPHRRRR